MTLVKNNARRLLSILLMLSLLFSQVVHAEFTQPNLRNIPADFVAAVKTNDPVTIAKYIKYPLHRQNPIPPIRDEAEFIERFYELFDDALLQHINTSDIDADWGDVGWRGIMLGSGVLWLDFDGKVSAINYQTQKEQDKRKQRLAQQRSTLHPSLRTFAEPVWAWQNKNYLIRIDKIADDSYRYASWKAGASQSSKPDLVITGGKVIWEGSARNSRWVFTNGKYRYVFYHNHVYSDEWQETMLWVYKGDKMILKDTDEFKRVY